MKEEKEEEEKAECGVRKRVLEVPVAVVVIVLLN